MASIDDLRVNGFPFGDEVITFETNGKLTFNATLGTSDPIQTTPRRRLRVLISLSPTFASYTAKASSWVAEGAYGGGSVSFTGLQAQSLYYVRVYLEYASGALTLRQDGSAWLNRQPNIPTLTSPSNNRQINLGTDVIFSWTCTDPDGPTDYIRIFGLYIREAGTPTSPPGPFIGLFTFGAPAASTVTVPNTSFRSNTWYEWTVAGANATLAGDRAPLRRFYVTGLSTPPTLTYPLNDQAVTSSEVIRFTWRFRDPDPTQGQVLADIRYRVAGQDDSSWITYLGGSVDPGAHSYHDFAPGTFAAKKHWEYQVRTKNRAALLSDWSLSAFFWTSLAPGSGGDQPVPDFQEPQPPIGCGINRVYVYDRGGKVLRGEITDIRQLQWNRKRDDISEATLTLSGWGSDCGALLARTRCWINEIVIFRDGVRVWEGPITLMEFATDTISIQAKDVMAYPYRRIMRQGYNDSYQLVQGVQQGLHTVVERAMSIMLNCLVYDDPNVIPYLTPIYTPDDTRQSRVREDFSITAWGEIDDLAAKAGLDYTTVGRRVIFWDTHVPVGKLPEMRDGDFSASPIVTEYGMQTANVFAVTNNSGVYGLATRLNTDGTPNYYGFLEQISSAYGESTGAVTDDVLTPAALAELVETLNSQAERNIGGRYPTPLVVRVPDNSTLNPLLNLSINQLVPGVWIPLRATDTLRKVTQIQKLDFMQVNQDASGEKISVTMSPAPGAMDDPDSGGDDGGDGGGGGA